jgi:hypothetical protein
MLRVAELQLHEYVDGSADRIVKTCSSGCALNERMVMDQFWKGLLAAGELWTELAGG